MINEELECFADTRDALLAYLEQIRSYLAEDVGEGPASLLEEVLSLLLEILERTRQENEVRSFIERREWLLVLLEAERLLLLRAMSRPPQPSCPRDHSHLPFSPVEGKVYCLICTTLLYWVRRTA